jgi:hypothetical protein
MKIENQTPFAYGWMVLLDKQAAEHLVFALKATYAIDESGRIGLAQKQEPIRPVDEFYGEPGISSIRYEAELGPAKPATDVVLVGSAVARKPGTTEMEVSFRVGQLSKVVRVFGERRWKNALIGHSISKPLPFDRVPLTYENAYGGKDTSQKNPKNHGHEPRNPVGRGFRAKKSHLEFADTLLPNIEDPSDSLRSPGGGVTPQGFGFIGRDWEPRVQYAGTYDQKWLEERMPLLPLDFNERFHNTASPGLTANGYLKGNEIVELTGCTRSGRLTFSLPGVSPHARAVTARKSIPITLNLNTVLLDAETMRLSLLWKGDVNIHKQLMKIRQVECRLA